MRRVGNLFAHHCSFAIFWWASELPTIVRSQYFGGQASCPPYGLAFQAALAVNIDCLRHRGKQIAFECELFAGVVKFAVFYQKAVFGAVG